MISRREFLIALSASVLPGSISVFAQGRAVPRIGYLAFTRSYDAPFMQGLSRLGYSEGKNVVVVYRFADGERRRLPGLLAELLAQRIDVLVTADPPSFEAALNANVAVPIVMRASSDPVANHWVSSLARPGGNITGVFSLYSELGGKRLELLKEMVPALSKVLLLWDEGFSGQREQVESARRDAKTLGLQVLSIAIRNAEDIAPAIKKASELRANGMMALRSPLIRANAQRIVDLAMQYRLPAIYDDRADVESGGLVSYGASLGELYGYLAVYVDKILKGARPGDIPIEQATKLQLVINMKTAKALVIKVPQSMLLRVDQVIE
jgi:putative ABC transport system substrate-binding protein